MGRIKTQFVKRTSMKLLEKHSEKVTTSFEENKRLVQQVTDVTSKRVRNIIAGYLTRLKKEQMKRAY